MLSITNSGVSLLDVGRAVVLLQAVMALLADVRHAHAIARIC